MKRNHPVRGTYGKQVVLDLLCVLLLAWAAPDGWKLTLVLLVLLLYPGVPLQQYQPPEWWAGPVAPDHDPLPEKRT